MQPLACIPRPLNSGLWAGIPKDPENLPEHSVVVGGAISRGGVSANSGAGRFITGLGDPNNTITGNVGDIFQRIDGGVGATFYVKELDASPKTGWTAK